EGVFKEHFGRRPFALEHNLAGHELFRMPRLIELSRALPAESVEYNAGNLPISQDPLRVPRNGLSAEETIRRIYECHSWMVLKNVEADPAYRRLLRACLEEIKPLTELLSPGMCKEEAFIFISSPGSVTPYHIDNEFNFLLQISGSKTMNVF